MVVKQDGSVWGTGANSRGQLGDGSQIRKRRFVQVIDSGAYAQPGVQVIYSGAKAVAAGRAHTMVLKQDGTVWATGYNYYHQLGDGSTTSRSNFVQVINSIVAVAARSAYSMVLKQDGSVWTTGSIRAGIENRRFVQVIDSGVKAMAAGYDHSMMLKQDGSVWTAGDNFRGQLGDESTNGRSKFVQVIDSGVTAVAAGEYHSMVLKQDGSVWATGGNSAGQLGDGSRIRKNRFVLIPVPAIPWVPIVLGVLAVT